MMGCFTFCSSVLIYLIYMCSSMCPTGCVSFTWRLCWPGPAVSHWLSHQVTILRLLLQMQHISDCHSG